MQQQEIVQLLKAAIEASVFVAPTEPGLTVAELYEVGNRVGLKDGEIGDAMPQVATRYFRAPGQRLLLDEMGWHQAGHLIFAENPELRNIAAFDFVVSQLHELAREVGGGNARLDRTIMVDRAVAASLPRHDVEVAITLLVLSGQLIEEKGELRLKFAQGWVRQLPSSGRGQVPAVPTPARSKVLPHVRDVVQRRGDGRPQSAEPFPAFAEQLEKLSYGRFRLWWTQTVAELGRTDPNTSPLSALVLAAALVEGALSFVVKHAQNLGLGVFASTDFTKDPRSWRIDDLVASAARGGDTAIFDLQTKNRADGLIRTRQRIHAGRMLSEFPAGVAVPDLRPEEAREATAVAEQVVRAVLDWLVKYPPT